MCIVRLQRHSTWDPPDRLSLFVNRPTLALADRAGCTLVQTLQWSSNGLCVLKLPAHLFSSCQSLGMHLSSGVLEEDDEEDTDDEMDERRIGIQQLWVVGARK
jgi:hypothetical protein